MTARELLRPVARKVATPERIQRFLDDDIGYNKEPDGETCKTPAAVLRDGVAHCMEGALLAAAALRAIGHPPLLLDLESIRDDDHVLAIFKRDACWGAIAKSNYAGLRYREPVYRTLRELAISYFDHYYNLQGEKTLRAFSTRPVNLARFDRIDWMSRTGDVWEIPEYLVTIPHTRLLSKSQERRRMRMDSRSYAAGKTGSVVL